jgi:DNA replication protein DnaC
MNRRYERASTVLTSNKGFDEWGEILGDEFMAAALIFRDSNIMDSMIRGLTNKS